MRKIQKEDKAIFISMLEEFYQSDAVLHTVPREHFYEVYEEIVNRGQYMDGYVFEYDGKVVGFATIAKSFSTEAGGLVIWIEELYLKPEYRSKGLGKGLFTFIEHNYPSMKRLRLEVEEDNSKAIKLYETMGFKKLNYMQMIKEY